MADEPDMASEDLLVALAGRARERQTEEARSEWAALVRAEIDLTEARARAAAAGEPADAIDRNAALFDPLDPDAFLDGLELRLAAEPEDDGRPVGGELGGEVDNVVPLTRPDASADAEAEAEPEPRSETAARSANDTGGDPGRTGWWWIPGGMLVAAAAAIVLFVVLPREGSIDSPGGTRGGDEGSVAINDTPVPTFALETDGGLKTMRGTGDLPDESDALRYRRDTPFEWVLRPGKAVEGDVDMRAFAVVDDSPGLPLDVTALTTISKSGSVRVTGTIADLGLEPGRYTIVLAVGRPDALPDGAGIGLEPGSEDAWQRRQVAIVIED